MNLLVDFLLKMRKIIYLINHRMAMTKQLKNSLHGTSCDVFIMDDAQKESLKFKHIEAEERKRIMAECIAALSHKGWGVSLRDRKNVSR
jgi:hypothetical protein